MDPSQLLSLVLPDPDECRRAAEELRLANPNATAEQIAEQAVRDSRKWAASIGAATGAFANPFTMLPAAVADAAAMLRLEGKLAGTIAALLDPDSLLDRDVFHREVIRSVFPGAVSQALRRLGMRAAENATKSAVRRLASREVAERAARSLGVRLAEKAVATKVVPVVGAGIGAAWNYAEVHAVGYRAIDYHLGRDPVERRVTRRVARYAKDLPGKLRHLRRPDPGARPEGTSDCVG